MTTTLGDFYESGISNEVFFNCRGHSSSKSESYFASHAPISCMIEKDFVNLIDPIKNEAASCVFCITLKRSNYSILYTTEMDIHFQVATMMSDVIDLCGLSKQLSVTNGASITLLGKRTSPDILILQSTEGIPVLIVEVRKPHSSFPGQTIVEDKEALGQLFDYLGIVRSYYGQRDVYGIITSLREWRVVWLPDCRSASVSELAAMHELPIDQAPYNLKNRILYGTKVLTLSHPNLIKMVSSAVRKSYHSSFHRVSLIDEARCYVKFTQSGWNWAHLTRGTATTLSLSYPSHQCSNFYVLRFFHEGRDGRVQLVFTEGSLASLAILKIFEDKLKFEKEKKYWHEVYEIPHLLSSACFKAGKAESGHLFSLVIPFCFHATHHPISNQITFNFDLLYWTHMNPLHGSVDHLHDQQVAFLRDFSNHCPAVVDIAESAIHHVAALGLIHDDLEWRHVALMPIFDSGQKIIEMKPVLIDLTSLRPAVDGEDALKIMMERLEKMKEELI